MLYFYLHHHQSIKKSLRVKANSPPCWINANCKLKLHNFYSGYNLFDLQIPSRYFPSLLARSDAISFRKLNVRKSEIKIIATYRHIDSNSRTHNWGANAIPLSHHRFTFAYDNIHLCIKALLTEISNVPMSGFQSNRINSKNRTWPYSEHNYCYNTQTYVVSNNENMRQRAGQQQTEELRNFQTISNEVAFIKSC